MRTISTCAPRLAGYLAGVGYMLTNVLTASCAQHLQEAVPDFQLSAIRSAVTGLCVITGGCIAGTDFKVGREYVPPLIYYSACFLLLNVGLFGAAAYLPLADVQGVVTMASIVFALLQSKVLFNVGIAKSHIIATGVCLVGILLTAQPAWLFKKAILTSDTEGRSQMNTSVTAPPHTIGSRHEVLLGYTFSIIGGAAFGISIDISGIILKHVRTLPKATYTMLVCTVGSAACMFYLEDPVYMNVLNLKQLLLVLGHSLLFAATALQAIYASSVLPGPTLCILGSLEVVTMLASQYTLMHAVKPGNYNWIEVLGCVIIVFGASVPGVIDLMSYKAKANELS